MKQLILASTSTLHNETYLAYLLPELQHFFKDVDEIVFVPYAQPGGISYNAYTEIAKKAFEEIGLKIKGVHEFEDAKEALKTAKAIFVGGGNTFRLVNQLYVLNLMDTLRDSIDKGVPYLGTSAGSNIAGLTMQTTNDMPIVDPPSYTTLGCIPFNLNVHYIEPDKNSTHKGETRAVRIKEFHTVADIPVVGLREGSWLRVQGDEIRLEGHLSAVLFNKNEEPFTVPPNHLF
ncbi:dipeptidase PepE [Flavobacteriaceae bacterium F08102]|nr:dipeptidase PepE [Flavobacteriaceae bacterium F08102]